MRFVLAIAIAILAAPALAESNFTGPLVNLGYARYRGYHDVDSDMNVWMGIRYAAPPLGKLRWQAPQPPLSNGSWVAPAIDPPPACPQTGAFGVPPAYGFNTGFGSEDCLYLNVYAPPNATNLPVFLWIRKYLFLICCLTLTVLSRWRGQFSLFGFAVRPEFTHQHER